ncbi:MAG: AraC family transcriptional regulator [Burkholderiales bacterium]|nr:AraC family transcriptional regulator [Burkholderiales bacterium]
MISAIQRRVIPEFYVQLLYEYLETLGQTPETVLGEPWPSPPLTGSHGGIDVEHWNGLLCKAQQHLNAPALGLSLGQTVTSRHLGVLGAILLNCEHAGAALVQMERYQRLIFDVIPMQRHIGAEGFELLWDTSEYVPGHLVEETGLTAMVQFARSIVRGPVSPLEVRFKFAQPGPIEPYEDYFQCPVKFSDPKPGFRLDSAMLFLPLKAPDPSLVKLLEQHADYLLSKLPEQSAIVEQVRKTISYSLRDGEPDINAIANRLQMNARALQRKLEQAGTGFREELKTVRQNMATGYLKDPHLQIVDIALLLGYSEHSAFTRAYKGWTGKTPNQIRAEAVQSST